LAGDQEALGEDGQDTIHNDQEGFFIIILFIKDPIDLQCDTH